MTVANERGLNPKFKGASSEELLAELAARRAVLVSAMSAELAVWSQIAGPPQAATPLPPSPTSTICARAPTPMVSATNGIQANARARALIRVNQRPLLIRPLYPASYRISIR